MAGSYPDVPSNRIPYDRDGTQVYACNSVFDSVTLFTQAQMQVMNDDNYDTGMSDLSGTKTSPYVALLFPAPMDLVGLYSVAGYSHGYSIYHANKVFTSTDTTNCVDGTWTEVADFELSGWFSPTKPDIRNSIRTSSVLGVKGLRLWTSQSQYDVSLLHIYGTPSAVPGDNLVLYDPVNDARVGGAYFDFGNVPQTSSADKQFRIHNNSSTETASAITVSCETLTDTTPSVPPQFTFSTDGTTFDTTATIASLAPGATSSTIIVRRTTPSNAVLSLWWTRIVASAGSWA
jgi:hypothetical protein